MSTKEPDSPAFPRAANAYGSPQEGMSLRHYAAIKLKVPNSGTHWLDDMIRQSLRDDFAAKALLGLFSSGSRFLEYADPCPALAKAAYVMADAMLEARKVKA